MKGLIKIQKYYLNACSVDIHLIFVIRIVGGEVLRFDGASLSPSGGHLPPGGLEAPPDHAGVAPEPDGQPVAAAGHLRGRVAPALLEQLRAVSVQDWAERK